MCRCGSKTKNNTRLNINGLTEYNIRRQLYSNVLISRGEKCTFVLTLFFIGIEQFYQIFLRFFKYDNSIVFIFDYLNDVHLLCLFTKYVFDLF